LVSMPLQLTAFTFIMAMVIFGGAWLGFVNGYNAPMWVIIMMGGVGIITILGLLHDETEFEDYTPHRTHTSTHRRIVHIERPHRHINDHDFEDD